MSYIESSGKRAKEVMRGQSVWGFRLGCFLRLPVLNRVNPKSSPRTEVCRYTRKVGHSFHNACVRKLCERSVDCTGLHSDWSCQPYVHKFIQCRSVFDPMPRQVCANNCTVSIEHSTTAHHIPTQNKTRKTFSIFSYEKATRSKCEATLQDQFNLCDTNSSSKPVCLSAMTSSVKLGGLAQTSSPIKTAALTISRQDGSLSRSAVS